MAELVAATVLLVEDEEPTRTVVRHIREGKGYAVSEAGSGAAALRLLEQHHGSPNA